MKPDFTRRLASPWRCTERYSLYASFCTGFYASAFIVILEEFEQTARAGSSHNTVAVKMKRHARDTAGVRTIDAKKDTLGCR